MRSAFRDVEWIHNARTHSTQENIWWCWLRGCEWIGWPAFLSEPLVPILLFFWPLWQVLLGILIANICWMPVRYRVVSVVLGSMGVYFRLLKWPLTVLMGAYFFWYGDHVNALICALWLPLSGAVIGIIPPLGKIGVTQEMFMAAIGYEKVNAMGPSRTN
jgi:hypothetical protein